MNTKQKIQNLLQQTEEHYGHKTFELWFKWCQSVTGKQNEFQMVLCSPSINKWFHAELLKHEEEFLFRVRNYHDAALEDLHKQYYDCTVQLFNIAPIVLLQEVFRALRKATQPPKGELATLTKATSINHFQLN